MVDNLIRSRLPERLTAEYAAQMAPDAEPETHKGPRRGRSLVDTEVRFRLIVENVRDYAIFLLDPDGLVISWNPGAQRIYGYAADEILDRPFSTFYPPEDIAARKPELELDVARECGRVEDEGWRITRQGQRFWANAVITALFDQEGKLNGFGKITRDLTDRRVREEAERQAALHAEASRLKDDFLAIVSHELRTPLNVAIGQSQLLQRGALTPEQEQRAWASLNRNLQLQAKIVEDLLDVSRIVTGKLALENTRLDIIGLLREAVDSSEVTATGKGLRVQLSVPDAPVYVMGDTDRLRQVFGNLLSNAVKFTPEGGRIDVTVTPDGQMVSITVTDTGIGMEPEFVERAFDRFSQADFTTRREHSGLGLGLAIAHELTVRHGGTLTARSEGPGRGSLFEVRLPLAPPAVALRGL